MTKEKNEGYSIFFVSFIQKINLCLLTLLARINMKNYNIARIKLIIKENSYHYTFSVLISNETRIQKGNSYRSLSFNTNAVGRLVLALCTVVRRMLKEKLLQTYRISCEFEMISYYRACVDGGLS